mmetsp:Transcript_62501/g.111367  ORF Transcript_62501/g.111367 Transcript_62501/m.111367 type:complete len:203 (+) Transcript_62501:469-1077(+)
MHPTSLMLGPSWRMYHSHLRCIHERIAWGNACMTVNLWSMGEGPKCCANSLDVCMDCRAWTAKLEVHGKCHQMTNVKFHQSLAPRIRNFCRRKTVQDLWSLGPLLGWISTNIWSVSRTFLTQHTTRFSPHNWGQNMVVRANQGYSWVQERKCDDCLSDYTPQQRLRGCGWVRDCQQELVSQQCGPVRIFWPIFRISEPYQCG